MFRDLQLGIQRDQISKDEVSTFEASSVLIREGILSSALHNACRVVVAQWKQATMVLVCTAHVPCIWPSILSCSLIIKTIVFTWKAVSEGLADGDNAPVCVTTRVH